MVLIPSTFTVDEASKQVTFRTIETSFGDGYEQVAIDGINAVMKEWTVTFTDLTESEADSLMNLINGVYGILIDWQSPDDASPKNYRIKSYTATRKRGKIVSISCTLKFVNE